jgi:hypothetical protein
MQGEADTYDMRSKIMAPSECFGVGYRRCINFVTFFMKEVFLACSGHNSNKLTPLGNTTLSLEPTHSQSLKHVPAQCNVLFFHPLYFSHSVEYRYDIYSFSYYLLY